MATMYSDRAIERMDRTNLRVAVGGELEDAKPGSLDCCTGICSLTPGSVFSRAIC